MLRRQVDTENINDSKEKEYLIVFVIIQKKWRGTNKCFFLLSQIQKT